MANPTAGVPITTTPFTDEITKRDLAATAQTYYPGEAIGLDSSGNATKCDATAALKFAGFQADSFRITVDSGDAAGDKKVNVEKPRYAIVTLRETPAAGHEGKPVWWQFSNAVSYFAADDNTEFSNFAGYVHRVVDVTLKLIEIELAPNVELVAVTIPYSSPATNWVFVADRAYRVVDVRGRTATAAAFTGDLKKAATAVTPANGTSVFAANTTFNFNGTADANQIINLSTNTSVLDLAAGDALALVPNATATNAVGALTILLAPKAK